MRIITRSALTAGLTLGLCVAAVAQTPTPAPPPPTPTPPPPPPLTKAERIADRAIALLAGWKVKAAENLLTANDQELGATPEYRTALGYLRGAQGKGAESTELLQTAAAAKPTDPAPQYILGQVAYWRQKPADADTAWKAARDRARAQVETRSTDARAQYYLGAAQVRLKKFGLARTALTAARDAGFDVALIDHQLGLSYFLEEKWQDALKAFDAVAAKDPKFAHLYFYRGLAQGKLDHKDKMLVDLDLFVKLAPSAPEANIARANLAGAQR
jgi:tetratricopeptide (TPR) repeat protein